MWLPLMAVAMVGQDLPISLPPTVGIVPNVVQELSKKTGVPLRAAKEMENEVMGLVLTGQPWSEVKAKLAESLEAEWTKEGNGWVLARSNAQIQARKKRNELARLKEIEKAIEKAKKTLTERKPFDETEARALAEAVRQNRATREGNQNWYPALQRLEGRAPGRALFDSIITQLSPKLFLELGKRDRIVFSSQPTRAQRPLPFNLSGPLAQFQKEQELYSRFFTTEGPTYSFESAFATEHSSAPENIQKVLLIIGSAPNNPDGYQVRLRLVGPKGRYSLNLTQTIGGMFEGDFNPRNMPKPAEDEPTIEKDEADIAFTNFFRNQLNEGAPSEASAIRKFIENPEQNEPLGVGLRAGLKTLEKAKKPALVVASDMAFAASLMGAMSAPRTTLSTWKRGLEMLGHETIADASWFLIRPSKPIDSESLFVPRRLLGEILREYDRQGRLSLPFLAALSLQLPEDPQTSIAFLYLMAVSSMNDLTADNDWLRLYGLLNADSRGSQAKPQTLSLSQLNAAQIQQLRRMIYAPRWDHSLSESFESTGNPEEFMYGPSLRNEPTERFPNGLPEGLKLTITVSQGASFFPFSEGNRGYHYPDGLDANSLAWQLFMKERSDLFPWGQSQPEIKHFHAGNKETWSLRAELDPNVSLNGQLHNNVVDRKKKMTYAELPESFRNEVTKRLEEFRKSHKDAKPGDFGGGTRVPPPLR